MQYDGQHVVVVLDPETGQVRGFGSGTGTGMWSKEKASRLASLMGGIAVPIEPPGTTGKVTKQFRKPLPKR